MKANRKIMETKPEVTDEEIRGFMNFDKLLSEHNVIELKRRNALRAAWIGITVSLVASLGTVVYLSSRNHIEEVNQPETKTTLPVIQEQKTDEAESKNQITEEKTEEVTPVVKPEVKSTVPKEKISENKPIPASDSVVASTSVYIEAEPVAGFPHLYEYFNKELNYPKEAVKDSVQGVVTVSFVVGKEGKPEEVKIIHSLGAAFDQEVYRLIEQMPAWRPATMNGKPMRAKISLPLTFRLEKRK